MPPAQGANGVDRGMAMGQLVLEDLARSPGMSPWM
jgi:hypothetical protein